jgi:hypothetical protein
MNKRKVFLKSFEDEVIHWEKELFTFKELILFDHNIKNERAAIYLIKAGQDKFEYIKYNGNKISFEHFFSMLSPKLQERVLWEIDLFL